MHKPSNSHQDSTQTLDSSKSLSSTQTTLTFWKTTHAKISKEKSCNIAINLLEELMAILWVWIKVTA